MKNTFEFSVVRCFLIMASAVLMASLNVQAKEMPTRLGIGYRNSGPFSLPSIAATYFPNSNLQVFGSFGVDTEKDNSKLGLQAGLRKIVFKEDHMNFFMGGALALLNIETAGDRKSGFELSVLAGAEFWLSGLENLGFIFETGVAASNLNQVRIRTIADTPFNAGVIFYF